MPSGGERKKARGTVSRPARTSGNGPSRRLGQPTTSPPQAGQGSVVEGRSSAFGGPITEGQGPIIEGQGSFSEGEGPIIEGQGPIIEGQGPITEGIGLGYHSDTPDARDWDIERAAEEIASHARQVGRHEQFAQLRGKSHLFSDRNPPRFNDRDPSRRRLPDLRDRFPNRSWPVENQGPLQSCTAHAVIGLLEYLVEQGCDERLNLSRLFLYKVTRRLMRWTGDTGATIRATVKAAGLFGVPPEEYWPYDIRRFELEPDGFHYSFASRFQALQYARLDTYGADGEQTLRRVQQALADGFPVAFGFPVYDSVRGNGADIPLPDLKRDKLLGGHAVLAVGYNNEDQLIFRNSWGPSWGERGYGYLPFEYVRKQWAVDCWTVFREAWLNPERFATDV